MDTPLFEEMLKKNQQSNQNAEAVWDMRAKSFGKAHKKPEITYLKEASQQILSIEDAMQQYTRRFGRTAEQKGADLKRLLKDYAGSDTIAIDSQTTLAKILWKA